MKKSDLILAGLAATVLVSGIAFAMDSHEGMVKCKVDKDAIEKMEKMDEMDKMKKKEMKVHKEQDGTTWMYMRSADECMKNGGTVVEEPKSK